MEGLHCTSAVIQYHVTHLWKCSIIPNVTMIGEAVMHKSKFALLAILFDGVQCLFSRYLLKKKKKDQTRQKYKVHKATMFPIIIIITDKLKKDNKALNSFVTSSCIHLKNEYKLSKYVRLEQD